ncbi:MAG: thiamine-phosphate kinase [Candidatus Bathyarchaeota archaeon]|nr:thiamine-phosphate kinase [Candidatus Bathyarchaeota archaeon]
MVGDRVGLGLSEQGIIKILKRNFESMPQMTVPFGDDVSAVPIDEGEVAVLKTDMLVGKTDVPRGMSLWQAARKAVVMTVSDFASKGVLPKAALVSLGLPRGLMRKDVEEIAKGLNAGAREYGTYIIGGDTNETSDLVVAIQLFGSTRSEGLMLRSGAKPGDILAVTGFFGKTAAGLRLLLEGFAAASGLRDVLVGSVCMPVARLKEGVALRGSGGVTACMDSSDGLAWCLHELGVQSNVGFVVSALPTAQDVNRFADFNGLDACELTLYGGEEYELVATINPKLWSQTEKAVEAAGGQLLPIGKATRNKQLILDTDGEKRPIKARGFEHFQRS